MTLALSDPYIAGFAVFAGWVFMLSSGRPIYYCPTVAVGLAIAGYLIEMNVWLIANIGLVTTPILFSFLFQKAILFVASEAAVQPAH